MNAPSKFALIFASLALAVPQGASAAEPNAKLWNGTWHLDAAKSKFASSAKEASETRTYDISGKKVTMKSSSKNAAGKELNFSYTAGYDGKWYPMVGNPIGNRISLQLINPRHVRAKVRRDDRDTAVASVRVSTDGRRLTLNRTTLNARGTPIVDVLAYDKVR